ncbi:hypothetical protein C7S13_8377 [Burkholderia cepacia]|nr:hypothetical protein [Burkholderia cepacia]
MRAAARRSVYSSHADIRKARLIEAASPRGFDRERHPRMRRIGEERFWRQF